MTAASLESLLGNYVYRDDKSDKFWCIEYNKSKGTYVTSWGKNGYPAQGRKVGLTGTEALKKIREKISTGYRLESPGKVSKKLSTEEVMDKFDDLIDQLDASHGKKKDDFDFWDEIEKGIKK